MASLLHEAVVELLRNRPRLSLELLDCAAPLTQLARRLLDQEGKIDSVDLGDAKPLERSADFVASFEADRANVRVITEAQLAPGPDKRRSWPGYVAVSWARTGVPTYLLVLTLDVEVATWAAQAIDLGHSVFQPVVAGPEVIPLLVDAEAARRSPELAAHHPAHPLHHRRNASLKLPGSRRRPPKSNEETAAASRHRSCSIEHLFAPARVCRATAAESCSHLAAPLLNGQWCWWPLVSRADSQSSRRV
jgi:hypothetical protein